jgi:exopolysaccharide biosynthesis polyprenyl glycosylphosphotransferase
VKPSLKLSDRKYLLLLVDLLIIFGTTLLSLWIHASGLVSLTFNIQYLIGHAGWLLLLSGLWISAAYVNGLYDPIKNSSLEITLLSLIRSGMIVLFSYLLIFFYIAPTQILPRGIVVYQVISGFSLISLWRIWFYYLSKSPRFQRKVVILGAGWAGKTIAKAILEYAENQYHILGFIDDESALIGQEIEFDLDDFRKSRSRWGENSLSTWKFPVLGTSRDLPDIVKNNEIPEIILAITHDMSGDSFRSLIDVKEQAIEITLMTELYEHLTGRVPIEHIGDNWFVSLPMDSAETGLLYAVASRLFDIISASLGLILLLPFFPLIALIIYLDSPGPIFYQQERIGKGGKKFQLYKMRTMVPNAETNGIAQRAQEDDPRITRVGRWLRKFRLDEMPQLFNILKGDMSAVGPRPERPYYVAELDEKIPFHRLRNSVKPGMAGWAVVNFGYIDDLESAKLRLQYDLYYVKHQSLVLDFIILIRTFGQMLLLKGR